MRRIGFNSSPLSTCSMSTPPEFLCRASRRYQCIVAYNAHCGTCAHVIHVFTSPGHSSSSDWNAWRAAAYCWTRAKCRALHFCERGAENGDRDTGVLTGLPRRAVWERPLEEPVELPN